MSVEKGSIIVTSAGEWDVQESRDIIVERMENARRGFFAATLTDGMKVNFSSDAVDEVKAA